MDDNIIRPERIPGTNVDRDITTGRTTSSLQTDTDRDVDIRRTMVMGRDLGPYGTQRVTAYAPMHRTLHWGPIWAGLMTSLVTSMLLGALFLGLGFNRSYGVFGGLTSGQVGWGAAIAMVIGVFIGGYLCGYASDVRTKAESVLNGFMVGVMSIMTPLFLAAMGAFGAANTAAVAASQTLPKSSNVAGVANTVSNNIAANVPPNVSSNVRYGLEIAASNAWQVFIAGVVLLAIGAFAGYLGRLNREKAIELQATSDLDRATTY